MGLPARKSPSPAPSRPARTTRNANTTATVTTTNADPRRTTKKSSSRTHAVGSIFVPNSLLPVALYLLDQEPDDEGYSSSASDDNLSSLPPPIPQMDGWRLTPDRGLEMELMFGYMDQDLVQEMTGASSPSSSYSSSQSSSSSSSSSSYGPPRGRYDNAGRILDENYD